jgi:hypothetical protein
MYSRVWRRVYLFYSVLVAYIFFLILVGKIFTNPPILPIKLVLSKTKVDQNYCKSLAIGLEPWHWAVFVCFMYLVILY